jgi:hypothetical protein
MLYELLEENRADLERVDNIQKERDSENYNPYPNGWNRHDFYREMFNDDYISGFVMTYPHGTVIRQARSSYYWRGENQVYAISQANLYRRLRACRNHEDWMVENFVAYMRIGLFLDLLLRFNHVQQHIHQEFVLNGKYTGRLDLLFIPLAQHYGIDTAMLDMTSNLEVALFFACCTTTNQPNDWRPLDKGDFKDCNKSHGVLFRRPSYHFDDILPFSYNRTSIFPVGFQPFMRCHMQWGYAALMSPNMYLQKDSSFQYLKFPHDEKFCREIFERMGCGKNIYPHEGLNLMNDEINWIKTTKCFPAEEFDCACADMKIDGDRARTMFARLKRKGYIIEGDYPYIPEWKIVEIDKQYADFDIEKTYEIKLRSRLTYTPQFE